MALMEIDEVAVNSKDWELAKGGDKEARERIKKRLQEEIIYFHAMFVEVDEDIVSLRDLCEANIVEAVALNCRFYTSP